MCEPLIGHKLDLIEIGGRPPSQTYVPDRKGITLIHKIPCRSIEGLIRAMSAVNIVSDSNMTLQRSNICFPCIRGPLNWDVWFEACDGLRL